MRVEVGLRLANYVGLEEGSERWVWERSGGRGMWKAEEDLEAGSARRWRFYGGEGEGVSSTMADADVDGRRYRCLMYRETYGRARQPCGDFARSTDGQSE